MVVVNIYIKVMVRRIFSISVMIICKFLNFREEVTLKLGDDWHIIFAITYDHGRNQRIPLHHDINISIYYYHAQYGLDIFCFASAIQIFVEIPLNHVTFKV